MRLRPLLACVIGCLAVAGTLPAGAQPPDEGMFEEAVVQSEADELETDRDSFTPATTTAGAGRWIVEAAHTFIDNRRVAETHSWPELLVRYGIGDWLELRGGWNYEIGGAGNPATGNVPSEFDGAAGLETEQRMFYGLKARLTKQAGWLPQAAVIVHGLTPTGGESTDTHVSTTGVVGWTLPNGWTWDSALRFSTESAEEDRFNVWAPSTVLKVPVGSRWKVHAEYFGVLTDHRADETVQHFFSPGAHVLVTPNLELGFRVGWGLNQESPNFFVNSGLGWRF